jgi:two-component system, cell cycle sensor histidine kinase and response regulator CckA
MDPGTNPREAARLDALQQYHIVDTAPEAVFDGIARIAARICDTPMAMVTFIDGDHQSIKARVGINLTSTRREDSFCAHILDRTMPMVVEDPIDDPRFAGIPLVADTPKVRFYAGAPIRTESGFGLGAVCVLDVKSRHLEPFQLAALEALADDAMARLEARRATAGLFDVNAKFATAQLLAQVGSWETDVETGELVASDELHRLVGVPFGSLRHANQFRHFVHPDDRQRTFAARDAADDPDRPMNIEHRIVRSDGAVRWFHTQGRVERSPVTGRRRFVGTAQDITERHQTESRLREQAALIEGARDAIMVRSLDNIIQSWNSGAERIFGWTAEEATGRDAMQLLHRDPEASWVANAQLLSTGHWAGELRKVTKGGADVIVDGSWTLLRHSDGSPK